MESPNSVAPFVSSTSVPGVLTAPTCYDVSSETCPGYASRGYCAQLISINKIPILTYCAKSCNACNIIITTLAPSKDCYDNGDEFDCSYYAQSGYCAFNTIKSLCAATCKVCNPVTTTSKMTITTKACTDIDTSCAYWANLGLCSFTTSVFPTYCRKSCKNC